MGACCLLLDRPRLFDNHVIYDGHTNTYAFKHKGHSLTLTPFPQHKPLKFKLGNRSKKSLYMSKIQMESIGKSKLYLPYL